jgi:uridine phosphorylase
VNAEFPILEFDPAREAVIEPAREVAPMDVPEHCVFCFFQEVIGRLRDEGKARLVKDLRSELGVHPLYEIEVEGRRLGVLHPGIGAPLAAALLEEAIALGCRRFIACGSCGVLDREIAVGHVIVATEAVRDEGTSYHYLAPSRTVAASPDGVAAIVQALEERGLDYLQAKAWTTDAFYRETPDRVRRRREEGCLVVEMEAAAFFAVAQFRGVTFAQLLYGGDDVSGAAWDARRWNDRASVREGLFWLAAEACLKL